MQHFISFLVISLVSTQCIFGAPLNSAPIKELPPLSLRVGEQRFLNIPGLQRFTLGSDQIHALPPSRELSQLYTDAVLIRAVKAGHSDIWAWKKDGSTEHREITVLSVQNTNDDPTTQVLAPPQPLTQKLSLLQETEIQLQMGTATRAQYLLTGEIQTFQEAALISRLHVGFESWIKNETTLSHNLRSQVTSKAEGLLKHLKQSDRLRIEQIGDSVWVRGSLPNTKIAIEISRQIQATLPMVQIEIDTLPDSAPVTAFKVFLLEMKRTFAQGIGLKGPGASGFGAFHVSPAHWSGGDVMRFDLQIQAWESEGKIKVLSAPELVVRTPGEAELFAGGEIPIRAESRFRTQIDWKSYGLLLKLKTTHSNAESVRLEIHSEVSSLSPGVIDDPVPGLSTNRMKTQVDAKYGSPLFLSGLLQEKISETSTGLPYLRRIPVLGKLFGSEDYLHERSELIAVLFPSLTPPSIRKSALAREVTSKTPHILQNPGAGWLFTEAELESPTPLPHSPPALEAEETQEKKEQDARSRKNHRVEKLLLVSGP